MWLKADNGRLLNLALVQAITIRKAKIGDDYLLVAWHVGEDSSWEIHEGTREECERLFQTIRRHLGTVLDVPGLLSENYSPKG